MKDVVGFEGLYKVTSCGKIWSCRRNRFMKISGGKGNYEMICLFKDGKAYYDYIHRIVAKAYIPNPNNLPQVNHKDEVKGHNWVNNLEWCTKEYNVKYSAAKGNKRGKWRKVYCVELDKTFKSIAEAARATGTTVQFVWQVLNGFNKTAKGYHFQYAD